MRAWTGHASRRPWVPARAPHAEPQSDSLTESRDWTGTSAGYATIVAVCQEGEHRFSKAVITSITLLTELRNPCLQIDIFQSGLLKQVAHRDAGGQLVRKAGIMASS